MEDGIIVESDKVLNLTPEEFQKARKILADRLNEAVEKFDACMSTDDKIDAIELYSDMGFQMITLAFFEAFDGMKKSELK